MKRLLVIVATIFTMSGVAQDTLRFSNETIIVDGEVMGTIKSNFTFTLNPKTDQIKLTNLADTSVVSLSIDKVIPLDKESGDIAFSCFDSENNNVSINIHTNGPNDSDIYEIAMVLWGEDGKLIVVRYTKNK